jgi:hypothetical protein
MRATYLPHVIAAVLVGVIWPYGELTWKCRSGFEHSEACVWGRSYMSLSRWVEPAIIAPITFVVLVLLTIAWKRITGRSR